MSPAPALAALVVASIACIAALAFMCEYGGQPCTDTPQATPWMECVK